MRLIRFEWEPAMIEHIGELQSAVEKLYEDYIRYGTNEKDIPDTIHEIVHHQLYLSSLIVRD